MALIKINTRSIPDDTVTPAKVSQNLGRRNLVINGAMNVAQRGTSFSGTNGGDESQFVADRWRYGHKTGTVTITQNGVSDLVGFQNSVKIQVTGTGTAATGNQDLFETKIEGQDLVSAGWGQTGAKDLTLSFYYKSNSTDNRVAWFYNPERGRDFAVIFAASAVNTWERITINIPADQAFDDSNGAGLYIRIVLSSGSQFTTGLASTWGAIGNDRYAGVANFHSNTSNYVEFTGVQLETGTVATDFEHRSHGEELSLCQRYFYRAANGTGNSLGIGVNYTTTYMHGAVHFPVTMRATPTLSAASGTNYYEFIRNGAADYFNSLSLGNRTTTRIGEIYNNSQISGTVGHGGYIRTDNAAVYVDFDSEL